MPGRYIREGILDSERFNALRKNGGVQAQLFFALLLLVVDDYGRCKNHPIWLRSKAFPLRDDIREADISRWITACEKSGLLSLYGEPNGTAFLQVYNFGQQARSKSKYPEPPAEILQAMQDGSYQESASQSDETQCKTLQNNVKQCKTMFSLNDNDNDNDNDNISLPIGSESNARTRTKCESVCTLTDYPETVADVLAICNAIKSPMSEKQAQAYLDQRTVADWHQGLGGSGRKISVNAIPADIRRWIDRDKAEVSRSNAMTTEREAKRNATAGSFGRYVPKN